jgi:hypothetical protein
MPTLGELISALPLDACTDPTDLNLQARAFLRSFVEHAIDAPAADAVPYAPENCPNCDAIVASARTPYCSDRCREESAFVRQFRAGVANGALMNPDKQAMVGQALWHVLGGGYPSRVAIVPKAAMSRALARTEGACEMCGAPATSVDHIGSG